MQILNGARSALAATLCGLLAASTLGTTPGADAACLSDKLTAVTAKVEAAWNKYYPFVTSSDAKFFPDESPEGSKARYNELNGLLTELKGLDLTVVEDRIIRERYVQVVQERTTAYELKAETWWGKRYSTGLQSPMDTFTSIVKGTDAGKGDDALLAYYKAMPVYVDQWVAKMDVETPDYFFQVEKIDFDSMNATITDWTASRDQYAAPFGTAHAAEVDAVMAAWKKLADVYNPTKSKRKILRKYEHPGVANLPNGKEIYKWQLMAHLTSTDEQYGPVALHQKGLDMTADLNAKCLKAYGKYTNTTNGTLDEMKKWILTSKENNPFKVDQDVVDEYNRVGMKLAQLLTKEFAFFPICPYSIITCFDMDPSGAKCEGGIAYYNDGRYTETNGCTSSGSFVLDFAANGATNDFPKSMTTSLLMHESVPGHHMQVMLGQEADPACVPEFIGQASMLTVMVEGWALYAETLGFKIGAYDDPQAEMGHYQERLLRSCRLVLDTGIHDLNWSIQQCVDYFGNNTGFTEQANRAQCERYAVWPGQAMSYLVGSLAYEGARASAEKALSDKFVASEFHYHMLKYGDMAVAQIAELGDSFVKEKSAPPSESNAVAESTTAAPAESSDSGYSLGLLIGAAAGGVVVGALVGAGITAIVKKGNNKHLKESTVEF